MAKIRTHYDNLKVARNAPDSVIKAAYKALCQNYHPDKFHGGKEEAERIMKLINASYALLIDPVKRAIHDVWIQEQENRATEKNQKSNSTESEIGKRYNQKTGEYGEYNDNSTYKTNSTHYKQTKKNRIISFPNLLFVILYLMEIVLLNEKYAAPLYLIMAQAFGVCIVPFLPGLYYNLSKNESNIAKYIYIATTLIMFLILFAAKGQDNHEKAMSDTNVGNVTSDQTQIHSAQSQQVISSGVNSAQDIFDQANKLYEQEKYSEALPFYKKMDQYSGAQIRLGEMFENGKGVTKDYNQAVYWYRKATESGDENREYARSALNKLLNNGNKEISKITEKKYSGKLISLNIVDLEIHSILKILSEFSGENIIPSNSVAGKLSINVVDVPWDQVLNMVMEFTGYKSKRIGNSIYIITPSEAIQRVDLSKDKKELPKVPVVTKTKDTIRAEWEQETEYGKVHKIAEIKGNGRVIGEEINKSKSSTNSNYYGKGGNGTETKPKCEFKAAMSNEEIKNCQN